MTKKEQLETCKTVSRITYLYSIVKEHLFMSGTFLHLYLCCITADDNCHELLFTCDVVLNFRKSHTAVAGN